MCVRGEVDADNVAGWYVSELMILRDIKGRRRKADWKMDVGIVASRTGMSKMFKCENMVCL